MIVRHRTDLIADPIFETVDGRDGRDGIDGSDGQNGRDGRDGNDGQGFTWRSTYSPKETYSVNDVVYFKGSSWVCVKDCKGREPSTRSNRWERMTRKGAKGERGEDGISQRGPRGLPGTTTTMVVGSVETIDAVFDTAADKGAVVYVSGDGRVDLAQANGEPQALAIGLAADAVTSGQPGEVVTSGPFTNEAWNLTPMSVYYLDPSVPGGITSTFPSAIGNRVCIIGVAVTDKQLNIEVHWAVVIGV